MAEASSRPSDRFDRDTAPEAKVFRQEYSREGKRPRFHCMKLPAHPTRNASHSSREHNLAARRPSSQLPPFPEQPGPLSTMKTPSRFTRLVTIFAAVSMAAVAVAQPPPGGPGGPGGPFGPGRGGPGRGPIRPGPGPGPRRPLVELLIPPPPHIYRHREYASDSGSSTVSRVQRALRTRGYYSGPIDGDAGSGTRAGIRGFREDNGLGSSTRIDGTLLEALGL